MQTPSVPSTITADQRPQLSTRSQSVPNQPIVYTLQFRGEVERTGVDGSVVKTITGASSCMIDTQIDDNGVLGSITTAISDKAILVSELILTGATTFQQTGRIVFGSGVHWFRFATVGSGHFESASPGEGQHGAAIWRIERGELLLISAKRETWRFEADDNAQWRRIPDSADPLLLTRQ